MNTEGTNYENVLNKRFPDGTLLETIYDLTTDESQFVIKKPNSKPKKSKGFRQGKSTTVYLPYKSNDLANGVLIVPSGFDISCSVTDVFEELKDTLKPYVDIEPYAYDLAARYILMTYCYDLFDSIPYLRILGPWGSGKSRLLDILGSLAYHTTQLGANVTSANIFRRVSSCPGTLAIDEADFGKSDQSAAITQILNVGYRKTGLVSRQESTSDGYVSKTYRVFGPKLIAHRNPFEDDALESRLVTIRMHPTTRKDLTFNLPQVLHENTQRLRNRLLGLRLTSFQKIDTEKRVKGIENLEPRIAEIITPLVLVTGDSFLPKMVREYLDVSEKDRKSYLSQGPEGVLAQIIVPYLKEGKQPSLDQITKEFNRRKVFNYALQNRAIGSMIRGLGLETTRINTGYVLKPCPVKQLLQIIERYGLE